MRLTRKIAAAGCAALALTSAACSSSSGGGTGSGGSTANRQPYRLLVVVPLSGALKTVGAGYSAAVDYAVQQINADGGILGRQIKVTKVDDQSSPTQAATLVQQALSSSAKPDAVYGGATSNEALAVAPILSRAKIMTIGVSTTDVLNNPGKYPYLFRTPPNEEPFSAYLGQRLKAAGYKKITIVSDNNALGQSIAASEATGLKNAGLQVSNATFNDGDLDLSATLEKAKSQQPDAVVFGALLAQTAALVLQARAKVGMTVPFYADATTSGNVAGLVPAADLKNVSLATYKINVPAGQTPATNALAAYMKQHIGTLTSYMLAYLWSADAVKLLQVAAAQAKSTDADKMKAALENLDPQPAGTYLGFANYKFSSTSHDNTAVSDSDFVIAPLGPLVDGVFTPPPS